ncbi:MAG: ribonuclease [Frankiales bacterium]|nr:ribonuclease [Frankiales bacterium]
MIKPGAALSAARSRSGLLDHLVRTYQRYQADTGDRLAAAVTFYWFLSLFPILLLVLAGYGYLHHGDSAEQLNERLKGNLGDFLPTQLVDTLTKTLSGAKGKAGLLGLGGLLLAGLGWIDALREAIRTIWHQDVKAGNIVTRKLIDVVALIGLFATIAASAFVTGLAGSGPEWLLAQLGVDQSTAAQLFLKVLALAVGVLVDITLFLYLFLRLARARRPVRRVLKGAVFGAVGFGVLKLVGGFYVQHTTEKGQATYGTFAVVVGLLLFLNLVSRLILLAAAFVVTAPGDDDVRPSGTADREETMTTQRPERSWSPKPEPAPDVPASVVPEVQGSSLFADHQGQVRRAAQATAAVGGVVLAGVALYAARTLKGMLRR